MTHERFTPSPWKWEGDKQIPLLGPKEEYEPSAVGYGQKAPVMEYSGCGSHEVEFRNPKDADLIRKAPEIYEAAEAAYEWIRNSFLEFSGELPDGLLEQLEHALDLKSE